MLRGVMLCCLIAPVGADTVFLYNGTSIDVSQAAARREDGAKLVAQNLGMNVAEVRAILDRKLRKAGAFIEWPTQEEQRVPRR